MNYTIIIIYNYINSIILYYYIIISCHFDDHNMKDMFQNISIRYANQVLFGDEVLIQESNKLIPSKVIKVSTFIMQGNHSQ